MQFCLAFLALLLLLPASLPTASSFPRRDAMESNFNFPEFSSGCAAGSRAVQRWVALEKARIQFERQRGAGTLNRAPVLLDANKCAILRHGGPRLPLDVMVDSRYYAARWFFGQS
uniref:Secreted protein n=1 Tax=Macrostomum lignano TaxID=282301 RepID=A0A1I8J7X2_9PLAT